MAGVERTLRLRKRFCFQDTDPTEHFPERPVRASLPSHFRAPQLIILVCTTIGGTCCLAACFAAACLAARRSGSGWCGCCFRSKIPDFEIATPLPTPKSDEGGSEEIASRKGSPAKGGSRMDMLAGMLLPRSRHLLRMQQQRELAEQRNSRWARLMWYLAETTPADALGSLVVGFTPRRKQMLQKEVEALAARQAAQEQQQQRAAAGAGGSGGSAAAADCEEGAVGAVSSEAAAQHSKRPSPPPPVAVAPRRISQCEIVPAADGAGAFSPRGGPAAAGGTSSRRSSAAGGGVSGSSGRRRVVPVSGRRSGGRAGAVEGSGSSSSSGGDDDDEDDKKEQGNKQ